MIQSPIAFRSTCNMSEARGTPFHIWHLMLAVAAVACVLWLIRLRLLHEIILIIVGIASWLVIPYFVLMFVRWLLAGRYVEQ
jgi:hypothetical protein